MDKLSVGQRITSVINKYSLTVNALAKQLQISQTTLSMQLKGERALSSHIVELVLSAFPNVSAEWLMRGVGDMLLPGSNPVGTEKEKEILPVANNEDLMWKAKYETIKECYDTLVGSLGEKK